MRLEYLTFISTLFSSLYFTNCISLQGYVRNNAIGKAYKIVYRAQPWSMAKDICEADGAKLAVPKSEEEFLYVKKLVRGMHYPAITGANNKLIVWLGISKLENFKIWTNIDGEDIKESGFNKWAEGNGQTVWEGSKEPQCAGLDAFNAGLRDWWCHQHQPFICEVNLKVTKVK